MDKSSILTIFDTYAAFLRITGISRQALQQWPQTLTFRQAQQVVGCAVLIGRAVPDDILEAAKQYYLS